VNIHIISSPKKVFDGDFHNFSESGYFVSENGFADRVEFKTLKPLSDLPPTIGIKPDEISALLKCKVVDFDGVKIYRGSKKGTQLYYHLIDQDFQCCLHVFSCGEFQPDRYICVYNGSLCL